MRFGAVSTITLLSMVAFVGCLPGSSDSKEPTPADGGSSGKGGSTVSSGGAKSTGGATTSATGAGGNKASGGNGGTVDTSTSGGTTSQPGSGGTGATSSSGGTTAVGGNKATGGTTSPVGGGSGAGGVTPSGGTASGGSAGGSCSDDPPPNQTPTCSEWVSYNTCSADWFKTYCNRSCGRCSGGSTNGGAGGSSSRGGAGGAAAGGNSGSSQGGTTGSSNGGGGGGGVSSPGSTNPPITGSNGFATRYWDCCKPSCSWTTNVPACQKDGTTRISDKNAKSGCDGGGSAFECYDFSPWYDAATNMSYGFAAHNGVACGTCFMLQFTGEGNSGPNAGASALKGQQMIVQAINIGGIDGNQFDLLIPGGGVGAMNGCSTQWGSSTDLGVQYGGLLAECKGDANCMKGKCQSVFGNMPGLLAGCNWFTGWFSSADNPKVIYKQVSCPQQIKSKSNIGN